MAYYFISDVHLGSKVMNDPKELERRFVTLLREISDDVTELFLVGDIFDFWYEYKRVVPKGFVRSLALLAGFADRGVKVHFFTGNHDIWAFNYLADECGVILHKKGDIFELYGKRVFLAHGDGIGKDDLLYKVLNSTFKSRPLQWCFTNLLHPDLALKFGHWWSEGSRRGKPLAHEFMGESERIVAPLREFAKRENLDYCVIGHLHSNTKFRLTESCELIILGEWIENPSYGVLTDEGFFLKKA